MYMQEEFIHAQRPELMVACQTETNHSFHGVPEQYSTGSIIALLYWCQGNSNGRRTGRVSGIDG
jgi:hypothetical protein